MKIFEYFFKEAKNEDFLDTPNVSEIKEATNLGVIDGVTTNHYINGKEKVLLLKLLKKLYQLLMVH